MREVNKKILVAVLLAGIMLATPMVSAVPWNPKPNNEKFQDYGVVGTFNYLDIYLAPIEYVPSFDIVNKAIVTWEENMLTYEITVDGETYDLDDFDYIGTGTFIFYDPVFSDPETKLDIIDQRAFHAVWDITYDFGDDDVGLDGTINVRAIISSREGMHIFSKQCTGDFKNVNIQATSGEGPNIGVFPVVTLYHEGVVSGWPE